MSSGRTLAKSVFAAVDAMKSQEFAGLLTEDGVFTFGNWPAVTGRAAIAKAVGDFFAGISSISHDIQDVWDDGDAVIVRLAVTYARKDGKVVTLPCANIWQVRNGEISDYRIYMDVGPVFA